MNPSPEAVKAARRFHEIYERLAPQFGYTTREDTRAFDPESSNGKLMIAVCAELSRPVEVAGDVEGARATALNVAGQCRATASHKLTRNIVVDGGTGLLQELLTDAAASIEALAATRSPGVVVDAGNVTDVEAAPLGWDLINPLGQVVATEKSTVTAWARHGGYKPTVEGLLGLENHGWRVAPSKPAGDTVSSAASGSVQGVASEVINFLMGIGPLEGCHFGEKPPTERGNFWWRKHLIASIASSGGGSRMSAGLPLDGERALPCPFCGHVGLDFEEGTTFRWILANCSNCGANCGETRVQTMGEGDKALWWEKAKVNAIKEWNTRSKPEGAEKNQDHLAACAGDGVPQQLVKAFDLLHRCSVMLDRWFLKYSGNPPPSGSETLATDLARFIGHQGVLAAHGASERARGDVLACGQIKKDVSAIGKGEADA